MYPLRVGVTMSIHKLTAGAGYDYLTRQVVALDATEKGHTGLASYYTERGETPRGLDRRRVGRDRRPDRRRPGDCRADASVVRLRPAPAGRAPPAAAGRTGSLPTRLPGGNPAGCAVQGCRWCCQPVPARGGQNASRQPVRLPAFRRTRRCRLQIGPRCGPKWPTSSSSPSMAVDAGSGT
jgi:hypothetical protein